MVADVLACIASYEDPDTIRTLETMLNSPGASVRAAVMLQTDDLALAREVESIEGVDLIHVSRKAARGACWPRYICQLMHEGEDWFFQCDSHMVFEDNWAADLIHQSSLVPKRSVLTSYSQATADPTPNRTGMMMVYEWGKADNPNYGDDGPHCSAGTWSLDDFPNGAPIPARFLSAHMLWAPGSYLSEVPYDPFLYFSGEEFSLALRSWTHGYNLYVPCATVCRHRYVDKDRKESGRRVHWEDADSSRRDRVTKARVATLYGWEERLREEAGNIGVYGLGTVRTREEFGEWAALDIANRKFVPDDEWRAELESDGKTGDRIFVYTTRAPEPAERDGGPQGAYPMADLTPEELGNAINELVERGLKLPYDLYPGSFLGGTNHIPNAGAWERYRWNPPEYMAHQPEYADEDPKASGKPDWEEIVEAARGGQSKVYRERLIRALSEECQRRITISYVGEDDLTKEIFLRLRGDHPEGSDDERDRLRARSKEIRRMIEAASPDELREIDPLLYDDMFWAAD